MFNDDEKNAQAPVSYTFEPQYAQQQPQSQEIPLRQHPAPRKKKGRFGAGVVALCLACALVAGTGGGALGVYYGMQNAPAQAPIEEVFDEAPQPDTDDTDVTPLKQNNTSSLSLNDIYELNNPAVVAISTESTTTNAFGYPMSGAAAGSGFVIDAVNGCIVTNNHVVAGANKITVTLSDGREFAAELAGTDEDSDLAVLRINADNLKAVKLGDSSGLLVGDGVVAIGNPLGELANTMTQGIISALDRDINVEGTPMKLLQTDASVSPGNSGGPLINADGEVIGIVNAKSSGSGVEGIGFAIPIDDAKPIIEMLIRDGYVAGKAKLGITIQTVNEQAAAYYNLPEGVYVAEVNAGSCAEKAGISAGDVITAMDGEAVSSVSELQRAILGHRAGDVIEITLSRDGQSRTVTVTLDEKGANTPASQPDGRSGSRQPFLPEG